MRVLAQGEAVSTKRFDGQYFPIRLEQEGLVTSLLNGMRQKKMENTNHEKTISEHSNLPRDYFVV